MKIRHLSFILLALLHLTSCGKSDGGSKKIATISPGQIAHLLEKQNFECASIGGGHCPTGIARLFILNIEDPTATELCTGFLTATNRLVSNAHCLASQEQCDNTYVSVYTGTSFEVAKCHNLLAAQIDGETWENKKVDYAVIELDRHIRSAESFVLAKSSPLPGENLTVWVVDHVDLFTGRITELECNLHKTGNSLELEKCPTISGNSGSPVVGKHGLVVGVLWGSTTAGHINEEFPLEDRRLLNDISYVTEAKYFRSAASRNN